MRLASSGPFGRFYPITPFSYTCFSQISYEDERPVELRATEVCGPDGSDREAHFLRLGYDRQGRLVQVDAYGEVGKARPLYFHSTIDYGPRTGGGVTVSIMRNLTQAYEPDLRTVSFTLELDREGRLVRQCTPLWDTFEYEYAGDNISRIYASDPSKKTRYLYMEYGDYDSTANPGSANAVWSLLTGAYSRNNPRQITAHLVNIQGRDLPVTRSLAYAYDPNGRAVRCDVSGTAVSGTGGGKKQFAYQHELYANWEGY